MIIAKCLFPVGMKCFMPLRKTDYLLKTLTVNQDKFIISNLEFVRHAARKGTRAAALRKKMALKLQQANKPAPIPKYLQRKVKVSPEFQRTRCTDENWLEVQPIDNVYNMKLYRGKPSSVAEAIDMHRRMHAPAILNDPSALIYANIELDLTTKKKNKFMDDFTGIVTYPHEFETSHKNRIIVICNNIEDQEKGTKAGAVYAGSTAIIKQILSGVIASDDFDYVICHPDIYKELNVLRGILKRKFPNANNGLLRLDIDRAVKTFLNGIEYALKRSIVEPDFGWVDVCFGRLDMPLDHLENNLKCALNVIEKHKPAGTEHLVFIIRTLLCCEKSREKLKIPHWEYLPNYPSNGVLLKTEEEDDESAEISGADKS